MTRTAMQIAGRFRRILLASVADALRELRDEIIDRLDFLKRRRCHLIDILNSF